MHDVKKTASRASIVLVAIDALRIVGMVMATKKSVRPPERSPAPLPTAVGPTTSVSEPGAPSLHVDETILLSEVMSAPEFNGFGLLLFSYHDRITDDMTVAHTGRLLPYHRNIRISEVGKTLNGMIAGVRRSDVRFHPIYSDEEIADDPAKAQVGLFFFHGDADSPFATISPGGGFSYVGSIHENFPYAQEYNAFVLNYRTGGGGRLAAEDLAAAIDYVSANERANRSRHRHQHRRRRLSR